jgi:phenylalanyl-tRNA synthetase beta chain
MIVTKSWLEEFIPLQDVSTQTILDTLNSIGQEVEGLTEIRIPKKIVIGFVEECEKHPDADKLNVCQVNIGEEITQIVCGASNVAKGQFVPVATVGAVLGEDFKIKKAKLRGVESFGMICSSTEIGLPKLNDGIMVLDESIGELIVGKELCEYSILNDDVIELGITPNRGDCFSIYGIARELSAGLNIEMKNLEFSNEECDNKEGIGRVIHIDTNIKNSSHFIKALHCKNKLKAPLKIDYRLALAQKETTHELDKFTKYASITTGVIINGFSLKKEEDKVIKLNLKEINGIDSFICENSEVIYETGIKCNYDNECPNELLLIDANFIPPSIVSELVHSQNLKTDDTFFNSSRGSEPNLEFGMNYLLNELSNNQDFSLYISEFDISNEYNKESITFNMDDIYSIIGQKLDKNLVVNILNKLGFETHVSVDGSANVKVPLFRHDIENKSDIAEEILRVYGIDKLESKALNFDEKNRLNSTMEKLKFERTLRVNSVSRGFYEALHFVFDSKERLQKFNFETVSDEDDILNPIVNELNTLRTTLLLQLLEDVSLNQKNGYKKIALFQKGSVYDKDRNEYKKIAFVWSGNREEENIINKARPEKIDFWSFAKEISNIIGDFKLEKNSDDKISHPYQNAKIIKDEIEIGTLSKVHPDVLKEFDIENDTFVCEIDLDKLTSKEKKATPIIKFQKSQRDLSLTVDKSIEYKTIKDSIKSLNLEDLKEFYPIDIFDLGEQNSLTIRFIVQNEQKTLTDEEINDIISQIVQKLSSLGINLR